LKFKTIFIIGLTIILISIAMFFWGIHMFSYRGDFTKLMTVTGEYSFILCVPTFLLGIILTVIGAINKLKK
jgi:hypothetical protein